jgi:hypothetical protein
MGRFQILKAFGDAAVLDKETGLVWEKSPSLDTFTWDFAVYHCATLSAGGGAGWRLPGISGLMSLVDPRAHARAHPARRPSVHQRAVRVDR